MTEQLYYHDPYIKEFKATIEKKESDENNRFFLVLNQTAFYPTGGGQPSDHGKLAGVPVVDVEKVNGEIRHYTEQEVKFNEGDEVEGAINWKRRFDHMQQHAGQHLISAIFDDNFGYKTLSFHLGSEVSSIDIGTEVLTNETAHDVEEKANSVCYKQLPISTKWIENDNELKQYKLRKPPTVNSNIRLVIIDGLDYNACGGTHPNNTGEIGPVKILSWERQKKNTRVYFVCGWRAINALSTKHQIVQSLTQTLSSKEEELPKAVEQLQIKQKELEKMVDERDNELLTHESKQLLTEASEFNGYRLITVTYKNRSIKECQKLIAMITDHNTDTLVILVAQNESRLHLIAGRGSDVSFNMNLLVKETLPFINGKGGGKPERAQGGGEAVVTPQYFLNYVLEYLEKESTVEG